MTSRRNLGGPVVRNRVWFFTGYQYLRDYDSQPGTDPSFPRTYEQNKIFGKVTWRIKPGLQLVSSVNDEHWVNPQIPTFVTPFEATVRLHAHVPTMTFGNLTHTLSPNTFWDLRVGRFVFSQKDDPSTGDFGIAEPVRPRDGRVERRAAGDWRADAHPKHGQGDAHAFPATMVWRRSPVEGRHADRKGRARRHADHPDRREVRRQQRSTLSEPSPAIPPFQAASSSRLLCLRRILRR